MSGLRRRERHYRGGGGNPLVFASDWTGEALSRALTAVRNTSKTIPWAGHIGSTTDAGANSAALAVIDTGVLGFPTARCLQVDCIHGSALGLPIATYDLQEFATGELQCNTLPVPAVGEKLFFRLYKRFVFPHNANWQAGSNNHCIEETGGSGTNWSFVFSSSVTGFNPWFRVNAWEGGVRVQRVYELRTGGFGTNIWLARDTVYRIEWTIERTGADQRTHRIRIYDAAGVLLYTEANFLLAGAGNTPLTGLTFTYNRDNDAGPPLTAQMAGFYMGTNGMGFGDAAADADPNEHAASVAPAWYFAGVAVARNDFCGAYQAGEQAA